MARRLGLRVAKDRRFSASQTLIISGGMIARPRS
jgi:hypothetical protein